ncbi:MAG: hypothetical protein EXR29_03480 [Betaproteobacteria bacterium]|nr:hypothetical protein [Betaproteobacteria bacterium]
MSLTVNARITPHLEEKLAEYCAKRGVTRSEAVVRALDLYLDAAEDGVSAWALAADLIPAKGAAAIQSDNVRELARKAMRGTRAR